MKICEKCKEQKESTAFYKDASRKDGLSPYCKLCRRVDAQARYQIDSDRIKARVRARRQANALAIDLGRFKMSEDRYLELLKEQDGKCAICGRSETATWNGTDIRRLSVDHNHTCCNGRNGCGSCNRGLLCNRCNTTLGYVRDDIEVLKSAINYLRKYELVQ